MKSELEGSQNNNEKKDLDNLNDSGLKSNFSINVNELAILPEVITLLVNEPTGIKIIQYKINEEIFEQLGTFIDENILPSKQLNKIPQFHYKTDENGKRPLTTEEKKQVYNEYCAENNQALDDRINKLQGLLKSQKNILEIKKFLDKHNSGTNFEQIPYFCEDCNKMASVIKQFFPNDKMKEQCEELLKDKKQQQQAESLLAKFFSGENGSIFLNKQINNDFIITMKNKLKSGCFVPINKTHLEKKTIKKKWQDINLNKVGLKNNNNTNLKNINKKYNENNIKDSAIYGSYMFFNKRKWKRYSVDKKKIKEKQRKNRFQRDNQDIYDIIDKQSDNIEKIQLGYNNINKQLQQIIKTEKILSEKMDNIKKPIIQKKYNNKIENINNIEYRKNNVIDHNIKDDKDYISKYGKMSFGDYKKKYPFPFDMEAQRRNQKIDIPKERKMKNKIYQQKQYEYKYYNFFNNQRKKVNNIYRENQMLYKDNQSKGKSSSITFG